MDFNSLVSDIKRIHEALQAEAAKSVNVFISTRNWLIGYYIKEFEQKGIDRASYGENLLINLENRFSNSGIKGMTARRFREYRRFYNIYPQFGQLINNILSTELIWRLPTAESDKSNWRLPTADLEASDKINQIQFNPEKLFVKLSYSHLAEIAKIDDPLKRAFYEMECIKASWSVSELERQINSLLFERSGLSKDKEKLSDIINQKTVKLLPQDIFNDPISIEFLGLSDRAIVTESDLEQAILDNLQMFLLEMGTGFCFEARQKRILIDDTYDFIDLVFYHRILKCHILIDLKTERFKHSHVGQINTYINYYKNEVMQADDNLPIGILLCTEKGDTMVKYATAGLEKNIFVQKYLVALPSKEEIENYIKKEIKIKT
jgi:predicted nuclease of restriction endonuclease-like (RecB) superfamily